MSSPSTTTTTTTSASPSTSASSPPTSASPSDPSGPPYPTPAHPLQRGRYITSNDPRGYIPVYEYPLNGQWIMMDSDDHYVLWTGIWKALGHSKADIVKMVDSKPELAGVIRRVRGGYLKIQGTWMPWNVARELARRVAYPIATSLIPLFGPSFPSTCLKPTDPGFGQLLPPSNHSHHSSSAAAAAARRKRQASTSGANKKSDRERDWSGQGLYTTSPSAPGGAREREREREWAYDPYAASRAYASPSSRPSNLQPPPPQGSFRSYTPALTRYTPYPTERPPSSGSNASSDLRHASSFELRRGSVSVGMATDRRGSISQLSSRGQSYSESPRYDVEPPPQRLKDSYEYDQAYRYGYQPTPPPPSHSSHQQPPRGYARDYPTPAPGLHHTSMDLFGKAAPASVPQVQARYKERITLPPLQKPSTYSSSSYAPHPGLGLRDPETSTTNSLPPISDLDLDSQAPSILRRLQSSSDSEPEDISMSSPRPSYLREPSLPSYISDSTRRLSKSSSGSSASPIEPATPVGGYGAHLPVPGLGLGKGYGGGGCASVSGSEYGGEAVGMAVGRTEEYSPPRRSGPLRPW